MKTSNFINSVMFILLLLVVPVAHAKNWTGNVSGYLGQNSLDDKDWPQLDTQVSIGVLFDIKQKNWPVSIAFDIIGSADVHKSGSLKDEGFTFQNNLGIRKIFELPDYSIKPYVGGGIAFIAAEIRNSVGTTTTTENDSATGTWLGGGMYIELTPKFNIGVDLRISKAEVTLFNVDREAGGLHIGVTAGYHW